ncbi:MAG: ABC transporter ATP-binding protein [Rhodospirillales bacterium CG15_BIG_FIL_POST_REV_8_21_14_020_66_15]|nr:MAG: ABC transporter ATP-binding protein [Rhodospirillales bacterium CG15_BIG_FIL_POST_REV_8_21_14_020_66_15]
MAGPAVTLENVTKSFGANHVLRGVDLDVAAGESLVVIGPSGTGKTVLLKTLIGVHASDGGRIAVDGTDVASLDGAGRRTLYGRFGMLFQKSGLFDSLPVWENVAFRLLQQDGVARKEARDRAVEKLGLVGLAPAEADLFPSELSGGMQKRVGIARAMAADPDVLLLDEPTAGLDPIMSNIINDLILEVMDKTGATVISVNSDMRGAARTARRAAMIYDGRIIWCGPTADMRDSGNAYVDQFVNSRAEGPIPTVVDPAA